MTVKWVELLSYFPKENFVADPGIPMSMKIS